MNFEVALWGEVRSGRWALRALAQQQGSGFLGQLAPTRILHEPALNHRWSGRDSGRQAWGEGARVRARPQPQVTRPPPSPDVAGSPPTVPCAKSHGGRSPKATARSRDRRFMALGFLSSEAASSSFHFHFPPKASRWGGGNPLSGYAKARGREVLSPPSPLPCARRGSQNILSSWGVPVWGPQPRPALLDHPAPQSPGAFPHPRRPHLSPQPRIHFPENHYSTFPHLCQVPSRHIGVVGKPNEMTNKYFNHCLEKIRFKIKTCTPTT